MSESCLQNGCPNWNSTALCGFANIGMQRKTQQRAKKEKGSVDKSYCWMTSALCSLSMGFN